MGTIAQDRRARYRAQATHDVIDALTNLVDDAARVVSSAHDEGDGYVIVNLYSLQDLGETVLVAKGALAWYREQEAEAAW